MFTLFEDGSFIIRIAGCLPGTLCSSITVLQFAYIAGFILAAVILCAFGRLVLGALLGAYR